MKKIKITNRKDTRELKYTLVREQKVNEWNLGVLGSDRQKGFLPVSVSRKMSSVVLTAVLDGYCSLAEYLPMVNLTESTFLRIAGGIVKNIDEGEALHFDRHRILLEPEYTMIKPSEISVKLILIPAEPFEKTGTLNGLLRYLADHAVFEGEETPAFLNEFRRITERDETSCFLEMTDFLEKLRGSGNGQKNQNVLRCPYCSTVVVSALRCPECGYSFEVSSEKTSVKENRTPVLQHCPDGEMIPVGKFPFRLGKSEIATEYCIKNKYVSSIHAEITQSENGFLITDRESTNGTYINGERIKPLIPVRIKNTDTITLGNESFIFRSGK